MKFVGANPRALVTGEGELPGKINYFIGHDPARWHTGVSTFNRLRVEEIYAGVNLVYYGNDQRLEYDFVVAPQADPAAIAIHFDGPEKVRVDARGDLVLSLGQNEIRQPDVERAQLIPDSLRHEHFVEQLLKQPLLAGFKKCGYGCGIADDDHLAGSSWRVVRKDS